MSKTIKIVATAIMATTLSCSEPPVLESNQQKGDPLKENMINANKYYASAEENEMDSYIGRHGWQMEKLSNGTRLWVYEKGNGKPFENEEEVKVTYSVEALNGHKVYDRVDDVVVMGRGAAIPGLEAALKNMTHGSKAKVVIPSAMAYGVVGDGDGITSRMVLVLDLEAR